LSVSIEKAEKESQIKEEEKQKERKRAAKKKEKPTREGRFNIWNELENQRNKFMVTHRLPLASGSTIRALKIS